MHFQKQLLLYITQHNTAQHQELTLGTIFKNNISKTTKGEKNEEK